LTECQQPLRLGLKGARIARRCADRASEIARMSGA
jgi:hypothetical protein